MQGERRLEWDGCYNARDLGGFPTADGRVTRSSAFVRSDAPDRLTSAGWKAAADYGIRTVIDLRNEDEIAAAPVALPTPMCRLHVPLDDSGDRSFWEYVWSNELDGSPLYFRPFMEAKPHRVREVMQAIAHAEAGGVLFHCVGGRDRTGLITLLLLALAGVPPEEIAIDYEASTERLRLLYSDRGEPDQGVEIAEILKRKRTSARRTILELLDGLDVEQYLRSAGVLSHELDAIRRRFVGR